MFQLFMHMGFNMPKLVISILVWPAVSAVQNRQFVIVPLGIIIPDSYSPECRVGFLIFSSQSCVVERFEKIFLLQK